MPKSLSSILSSKLVEPLPHKDHWQSRNNSWVRKHINTSLVFSTWSEKLVGIAHLMGFLAHISDYLYFKVAKPGDSFLCFLGLQTSDPIVLKRCVTVRIQPDDWKEWRKIRTLRGEHWRQDHTSDSLTLSLLKQCQHSLPALTPIFRLFRLCYAAAATAKSLQLCPTLCDPIEGSPPGSPVPGILQARTLEWAAIFFSNAWKWNAYK